MVNFNPFKSRVKVDLTHLVLVDPMLKYPGHSVLLQYWFLCGLLQSTTSHTNFLEFVH
jgi:hypothetical protein